jgi:hypothetical protein
MHARGRDECNEQKKKGLINYIQPLLKESVPNFTFDLPYMSIDLYYLVFKHRLQLYSVSIICNP